MKKIPAKLLIGISLLSSLVSAMDFELNLPEDPDVFWNAWLTCTDTNANKYILDFTLHDNSCDINDNKDGKLLYFEDVSAFLCETDDPPLKMWVNFKELSFRYGVGRGDAYVRLIDSGAAVCELNSPCGKVPCFSIFASD